MKQDLKCKMCSNVQMFFLHLNQMDCPIVEVPVQADIFVRSLGQADLWSDFPPSRDISWPSLELWNYFRSD